MSNFAVLREFWVHLVQCYPHLPPLPLEPGSRLHRRLRHLHSQV